MQIAAHMFRVVGCGARRHWGVYGIQLLSGRAGKKNGMKDAVNTHYAKHSRILDRGKSCYCLNAHIIVLLRSLHTQLVLYNRSH
jgi:hypothetical protein